MDTDLPMSNQGKNRSPFPHFAGLSPYRTARTHMLSAERSDPRIREESEGGQNSNPISHCPQMGEVTTIADHLTTAMVRINNLRSAKGWYQGHSNP